MSLIEKTTEIGNSIIALIDAKTGGAPDGKTVKSTDGVMSAIGVKESNKDKAIKTWVGTLAEYEALESVDENTLYNITDDVEGEEVFTTTKVNLDGSNYEGSGLQTVVDSNLNSKMTNCITEIPQRIKLELKDGVLTLKAGSEVIVPNGFEEDGVTPKFDYVTVENDLTTSYGGAYSGTGKVCYNKDFNNIVLHWDNNVSSGGTTTTEAYSFYYNTVDNKVYNIMEEGTCYQASLPLCNISVANSDGIITSIDQVFNGVGYIGSLLWVDKGVKGFRPDGKDEKGILKNVAFEITKLSTCIRDITTTDGLLLLSDNYISYSGGIEYRWDVNFTWNKPYDVPARLAVAGSVKATAGVIERLVVKEACRVLSSGDKEDIASYAMPSSKYIDLALGATGTSYIAPANGWFHLMKKAVNGGEFVYIGSRNGNALSFMEVANTNHKDLRVSLPVRKGDPINIQWTSTGDLVYFRFIYAQGEV